MQQISVPARIKVLREKLGLSQRGLARKAGLGVAHVSLIENRGGSITLETARRLAAALEISLDDLVKPEPPKPRARRVA